MDIKDDEIRNIDKDLFNLIFTLNLYLEAGYVLAEALKEISKSDDNGNICIKMLSKAYEMSKQKNMSMIQNLILISQSLKSINLLRFVSILSDNENKGSELFLKLEQERKLLQSMNINRAKAKAKEVESKLSFPLALLLISLVIICIAPAMISM